MMTGYIKENRKDLGEKIYLIYFALMMGARAYGLYEGLTPYTVILVLSMLLFAFKIVISGHTLKEYAVIAGFMLVAGMVYLHTGEKGLIVCFSMMLGMKGVSRKKVISTGAIVAGVIILYRMFLGVFGMVKEMYYPQERAGVGLMFRHSLGYAHPNTMHMNVLILGMMIMYLITSAQRYHVQKGTKSRREAVLVVALSSAFVVAFNLYVFQYTGSRTGVLAGLAYLICNLWLFVRDKTGIFEKIVLYLSFPAVCFISIVMPLIIPDNLYEILNSTVFNNRYMLIRFFWQGNSVTLWGTRLVHKDGLYMTYGIDTAQMYLFLQLGLVAFAVISALTMWFIHYGIKSSMLMELAALEGILFLGIWEPLLYNLSFKNFSYVFMGAALFAALSGQKAEIEEYGELLNFRITGKTLGVFGGAAAVGVAASMIYMLLTVQPTALYGDRQQTEEGNTLGMEAMYFEPEEIASLRADGELVVGYIDVTTPMYKYDSVIASMEYDKKILSTGVWCGMLVMLGYCVLKLHNYEKKKHGSG